LSEVSLALFCLLFSFSSRSNFLKSMASTMVKTASFCDAVAAIGGGITTFANYGGGGISSDVVGFCCSRPAPPLVFAGVFFNLISFRSCARSFQN
jgi:hypothetical protein